MIAGPAAAGGAVRRVRLITAVVLNLTGLLGGAIPVHGANSGADTTGGPSPRGALCRSLLLPGWGQLANGKPIKAVLSAATSTALLASVAARQRSLGEAATSLEHQDRAGRRNTGLLLLGLSVTLSALDAYVDAQLRGFTEIEATVSVRPEVGGAMIRVRLERPGSGSRPQGRSAGRRTPGPSPWSTTR
jgi:hypothetical protein